MRPSLNIRAFLAAGALAALLSLGSFAINRGLAQNAGNVQFTPTGTEMIQIYPAGTAANVFVPLASFRDGAQWLYNVPLTGFTIVMTPEQSVVSLNPAGAIATGTITFPPTLYDGKIVSIFSSQAINTTLTLNTSNGATFVPAAPTTLLQNGALSFIYDKALNQWHRFQ
jgi:hypothetical protein